MARLMINQTLAYAFKTNRFKNLLCVVKNHILIFSSLPPDCFFLTFF